MKHQQKMGNAYFWREINVSYKFASQILIILRAGAEIIIHHKFSLPSASLLLVPIKPLRGKGNLLYIEREGIHSTRQKTGFMTIPRLFSRNKDRKKVYSRSNMAGI